MRHKVLSLARQIGWWLVLLTLLASPRSAAGGDLLLDPLRNYLMRTVVKYVSQSLRGSVEVGALHGSLLSAPVLQDIVIRDAQGTVVGRIAAIRLTYGLTTLLKGRLDIQEVEIVQPWLHLIQEPDGRLNFANLLPAAPPQPSSDAGLPLDLHVARLQVRDGHLSLQVPALPGVRNLTNVQALLSAHMDQQGLRAQVQQFSAHADPADVDMRTLAGSLHVQAGQVQVEHLRLQTGQTTVTAQGALLGAHQAADFALQLQPLDLTEIGRLVHRDTLQGHLRLDLQAVGPPEALQVRSQISVAEGSLNLEGRLNTVATPLRYSGELEVTHLNLAALLAQDTWHSDLTLHLRLHGEGVALPDLRGEVALDIRPSQFGEILLQPSSIHFAVSEQRLEIKQLALHTSVARLSAAGSLALAGSSDLQYTVATDLSGLKSLPGLPTLAGSLELRGQASGTWPALNTSGTLQGRELRYLEHRLDTLQLTYEASQLGAQPHITAQLQARQAQAGPLPLAQVRLDATYQGDTRQVHFATDVAQAANTGGQARGTLTLDDTGQQVVLESLQVQLPGRTWHAAAPLHVAFAPARLEIKHFHLVHADEAITLAGTLDAEHLQDVRVAVTRLDLSYLQKVLHLPDVISGRATLQAQLAGTRAEPHLQGDLTFWPATRQHLPLEQLQTTLVYAQQQLYSTVRLQQDNREVLSVHGQWPLDLALTALPLAQRLLEAPLRVQLRLQQPDLTAVQRWQPAWPALSGTVQGTADLHGTYTTLNLAAALQLQKLAIAGVAQDLSALLQLTGTLATAASLAALVQEMQQGGVTPQVRDLTLRIPTLGGLVPRPDAPAEIIQIQDLVLQAKAQWTAHGVQATLQRLHMHARGFGVPSTEVTMAAQWSPARLEVTQLHLRQPASEVQGHGHLTLPELQGQLRLDIPRLRLDTLPVSWPSELPPEVQGWVTVRGSLQVPQVEARLQYAGGQIGATLATRFEERLPHYQATLHLDGLDLSRMLPEARGKLRAHMQLQGSGASAAARQATLALTADTDGFTLAPGLAVQAQARLQGNALQVTQFHVRSVPVDMQASGTLSATQPVALQYRLRLGDLTALRPLLGVDVQAQGTLSGEAQGALNAVQTRGTLQLESWRVADLRGQRLQATYAVSQLSANPQATVKAQLSEVQGYSLPKNAFRLEGTYASQRGTFTVAVTEGPYQQTRLGGNFVLAQEKRFTLETLRVRSQKLRWDNVGPIQMLQSPQGAFQVQRLHLRSGAQEVRVHGSLSPQGAMQAQAHIAQVQIQPVVQVFAPDAVIPDGRLTLDLSVGGTLQQPQLQGQLQLTALKWLDQEMGEMQGTIGLNGKALQTNLRWRDQGGDILRAQGGLELGSPGALDLQLLGSNVNLGRFAPLSPEVTHSAGALSLDLRITGTLQQPQAQGALVLRDGALQLATTRERYTDIQARLVFTGQQARLERLQVGSRTGPLQLTGLVDYAGLAVRQVNLSLQAQNFTAINTPDIEAVVSTQVTVQGTPQALDATGSVTIPRARVNLQKVPGSGPKIVEPWQLTVAGVYGPGRNAVASPDDKATAPSLQALLLPAVHANLQIDIPRQAWIQGPGTAVEVSGRLWVTKARQEPFILSGSIETVRGFASYYSRRFEIEKGQITFTGAPEINPLLDVMVTRKVSDYVVSIHTGGTAQQPDITFSSTPALAQIDIVSLLVIGKTTDRLTGTEQNTLSGQAQQLAGTLIATQLEKLGSPLGLDSIAITAGDRLGAGTVKVGRYVTQDIFLSYERELGGDNANTVGVEYSLSRRLKLKGSSSDAGESAIDVLWRIDY